MKVNVFTIRLLSEKFVSDQKFLNDFLETIDFIKSDAHLVEGEVSYWSVLIHFKVKKTGTQPARRNADAREEDLNPEQLDTYSALKNWRAQKSIDAQVPSFTICHNSQLLNVIVKKPGTLSDLRKIKGFGELKVESYGEEILAIINRDRN